MRLQRRMMVLAALAIWLGGVALLQAAPLPIQTRIALQLDALASFPDAKVAGEKVHALKLVAVFYAKRHFTPAWSSGNTLLPQADELIVALTTAGQEGLRPADYHLGAIRTLRTSLQRQLAPSRAHEAPTAALVARLELLLTDAFITYGSHLAKGRLDPEKIFATWDIYPPNVDPVGLLQQALEDGRIGAHLRALLPDKNGYFHLRQALGRYRDIAEYGGWPPIPTGAKLYPGTRDARVALVRQRLILTGDLAADGQQDRRRQTLFDAPLEQAVRHYQQRMGLMVDGVLGARTVAALNVPVGQRIRQIIINMERLRWLPRDLGERYVQVNIAAFSLKVVEDDEPVLTMRAIVGKPFSTTPIFTRKMEYLVINPAWNLPESLILDELVPRLRQDPGLLKRRHIRVFSDWSSNGYELDPADIDWADVKKGNFPYYLRQDPGPFNELGRFKFMFPNKYSVYLHDTPHKHLFEADVRNFSHGCVRLERPKALASYLLRDDPEWDEGAIDEAVEEGEEQIVSLRQPVPVYFLYLTAWADGEGVHFRDDIYERDRPLMDALL